MIWELKKLLKLSCITKKLNFSRVFSAQYHGNLLHFFSFLISLDKVYTFSSIPTCWTEPKSFFYLLSMVDLALSLFLCSIHRWITVTPWHTLEKRCTTVNMEPAILLSALQKHRACTPFTTSRLVLDLSHPEWLPHLKSTRLRWKLFTTPLTTFQRPTNTPAVRPALTQPPWMWDALMIHHQEKRLLHPRTQRHHPTAVQTQCPLYLKVLPVPVSIQNPQKYPPMMTWLTLSPVPPLSPAFHGAEPE